MNAKSFAILGTRGIPAMHGGFETFAESLSLYLSRQGWLVTVYCQGEGGGPITEDQWRGIHRVHIPIKAKGAAGTIIFDWKSTVHASRNCRRILTLGYNTAAFCVLYRLRGVKNAINMDGIEWMRGKWSKGERAWLYINEKLGALLGNHLVADHPEIKNHLATLVSAEKISIIPYGADYITSAENRYLQYFNLSPRKYAILIARPEPENSILEIVRAFSQERRGIPLLILGDYSPEINTYHRKVFDAAGEEVKFAGAIYNKAVVQSLRFYARLYIHGHTVGGTNPSLVEALGAGSPILAHNNKFNQWVAGVGALYFSTEIQCAEAITRLVKDDALIDTMRAHSRIQFVNNFTDNKIHAAYEKLIVEKLS